MNGYPAGDGQVVDARQVLLQLQELLEVLHLHHGALELQHQFRNVSQGGCNHKQREDFLPLVVFWKEVTFKMQIDRIYFSFTSLRSSVLISDLEYTKKNIHINDNITELIN